MITEVRQAIRLGRQLAANDASDTEITDTIIEAFDYDEPRSRAFAEVVVRRVKHSIRHAAEAAL